TLLKKPHNRQSKDAHSSSKVHRRGGVTPDASSRIARRTSIVRDDASPPLQQGITIVSTMLKAGLVGCGSLAQRGILPHLSLPDARQKVQLTAVVDAVPERARLTAERFHVPAYY